MNTHILMSRNITGLLIGAVLFASFLGCGCAADDRLIGSINGAAGLSGSLLLINLDTDGPWVVLAIKPNADSGAIKTDDVAKKTLGKNKISGRVSQYQTFAGHYQVVQSLSPKPPPKSADYDWTEQLSSYATPNPDFRMHEPFESDTILGSRSAGGSNDVNFVVTQLFPESPGIDRFRFIYWIPSDWNGFVLPAVKFIRKNPNFAKPHPSKAMRLKMLTALHYQNPLIGIAVLSVLASEDRVPYSAVGGMLSTDEFMTLAVLIDCLTQYGWLKETKNTVWMRDQIARRHSFDFSAAVIIGLYSVYIAIKESLPSYNSMEGAAHAVEKYSAVKPLYNAAYSDIQSYRKLSVSQQAYKQELSHMVEAGLSPFNWPP